MPSPTRRQRQAQGGWWSHDQQVWGARDLGPPSDQSPFHTQQKSHIVPGHVGRFETKKVISSLVEWLCHRPRNLAAQLACNSSSNLLSEMLMCRNMAQLLYQSWQHTARSRDQQSAQLLQRRTDSLADLGFVWDRVTYGNVGSLLKERGFEELRRLLPACLCQKVTQRLSFMSKMLPRIY